MIIVSEVASSLIINFCSVFFVKQDRITVLHTQTASVQLHPHGNVSIPGPWLNSDITGPYGRAELVHHNKVSFSVSLEEL